MLLRDLTSVPVIDAHVHVFPDRLFAALRAWFDKHAYNFLYSGSSEELIQAYFNEGAAGMVLLSYAHRPDIARGLNEFVGGLIRKFPHTAGLAAVHPHDKDPKDILRHAFEECGLCGVKMHCHVKGVAPDDPAMFPIYESVTEFGGVVCIHAGREPVIEGYQFDIHAITGAERVEKVLRRFPDLKMIIPHMGFDETERFCNLLDEYPNLYLDTTMVLIPAFGFAIERDVLVRHTDRLLYGTDYPNIPYPVETELKAILKMDPGEEVLRRILLENAQKLFPLEPRM